MPLVKIEAEKTGDGWEGFVGGAHGGGHFTTGPDFEELIEALRERVGKLLAPTLPPTPPGPPAPPPLAPLPQPSPRLTRGQRRTGQHPKPFFPADSGGSTDRLPQGRR